MSPVEKQINNMRITSNCRYNAFSRLDRLSRYSFATTILLSLGLIFIPLLQYSDIPLHFMPKILNMMQIFLAVNVLVYSAIIGTARYDVRAIALYKCADKVKNLINTLRDLKHKSETNDSDINLKEIYEKYQEALDSSENHSRLDFLCAKLEMSEEFKITGLKFFILQLTAYFLYLLPFTLPTLMIVAEFIFISDMLNITDILPSYFGGDPTVGAK